MSAPAHATRSTINQEGSRFGDTSVTGGLLVQGNAVGFTITFVPRPVLHDRIREQLHDGSDDAEHHDAKTLVVWGLGGAGKTQLALNYRRRHRSDYKATFWIEAGSKESIERDFMEIYQLLFDVRISAGQEVTKIDNAILGVKSWFSGRRDRWLLIFDGADAIDNEQDSDYVDLKHYMPESPYLHTIITTRCRTAKDMTLLEGVEVGEMNEGQAVELFYRSSELRDHCQEIEDEVKCIVKELGYLALAVTLAGTYVSKTPRLLSNVKLYRPEYIRRREDLLSRRPVKLIHQYTESVLTTWETSFQAIEHQCIEASRLLTLLAFLSFDDIFLKLFVVDPDTGGPTSASHNERETTWRSKLAPGKKLDIYKIEECFCVLQAYSLVQWNKDQDSYSMHKLVHAWGHDRLSVKDQRDFTLATVQLLGEAISNCDEGPQDKLRLVPHLMVNFGMVVNASGGLEGCTEVIVDQLERMGGFTNSIGSWTEAGVIREYVVGELGKLRGEEHPFTIKAMGNLANTLRDQGQLDEAARMQKEVLEKRRRILSEEHPDTISAMSNLAATLRDQGQLDEAARMQKEVLEKRRRILSEEHPSTISAMSNLAITLGDQGQLDEAARMQKEVLEKRRRILSEEHPSTISAMSNLAITLGDQGQLDEAARMQKEVLEKRRRILGEEHPDTITAMSNLATTLGDQGQLDEAARMKKEVLEKMKRILGEEHPDTITAMSNLAATLGDQGQLDKAARMKKEVLEKMKRILSEEHPFTISAMSNLAATLRDQGQLDEAARMQKEVLEKRRRILSEEHPDTISAMSNLAATLGDQGQLDEAARMKKEVLEKMKRILGEEHPDTITAMSNLANTLGDQGQLDEAVRMQKEVLEKRRRILGEEHPDTILAMSNLAATLGDQGQLDEAARMQKEVLEKRRRILGEEHPSTITAMSNLAATLRDQGQLDEAARMKKEVLEKRRRILSEEHPSTITAMSNLANTLRDQGQLNEAARMQKEVLEKRRRILSEEHPSIITAMSNLAATLRDQGQLDEAAR